MVESECEITRICPSSRGEYLLFWGEADFRTLLLNGETHIIIADLQTLFDHADTLVLVLVNGWHARELCGGRYRQ
jgi:hypothetical protein